MNEKITIRGSARKPMPSKEFLEECFDANFEKGILIWKNRPPHHFPNEKAQKGWNGRFPTMEAGSKCCRPDGRHRYRDVGLKIAANGAAYLYSVHFILWIMAGKEIPVGSEIDHKSPDAWDNRLTNLRLASPSENQGNARGHRKKKSGLLKWVFPSIDSRTKKQYGFMSKVSHNKHSIFVGIFSTEMEAHLEALRVAESIHGEFVNCGCDTQCTIPPVVTE